MRCYCGFCLEGLRKAKKNIIMAVKLPSLGDRIHNFQNAFFVLSFSWFLFIECIEGDGTFSLPLQEKSTRLSYFSERLKTNESA
jgi:hypothetical protein